MKRLIVSVALVASACAGARLDTHSRNYRLTAGVATIPFEEDLGQVWIEGRIGDSPPIAIGIDTGAAVTVIDRAMAETLGLRIESAGGVGGAGGVVESGRVANVDLRLAGAELDDLTMHAIDLAPITARSGRAMSMILGYDLFSRFVVEIDYDARELRLHDAESWVAPSFMTPVPIEIEENNPYVRASVTMGGVRESGLFVIDSGGSGTVIFMPSFVRDRHLLDRVSPTLKSRAGGVGGEFTMHVGRIDEVTVGDFTIRKPIAMLPASGELAVPGSAGNLGGALLRRFRVVFDYSRGQMLLSPSRHFDAADEFDMSGVALMAENGLTRVRVVRVREESPGAEAGLRAGDELMSVDGIAAPDLGMRAIAARFRRPDREHRLRIRRDGQELEITLRTRRLI